MSLCLTIKKGQRLFIGDDIVLEVTKAKGGVGVAIDAPDHVRILREGVKPDEPDEKAAGNARCEKHEAAVVIPDGAMCPVCAERQDLLNLLELCRVALDDCNRGDLPSVAMAQSGLFLLTGASIIETAPATGEPCNSLPSRPSSVDPIVKYLLSQGMPPWLSVDQIVEWLTVMFRDAETETKRLQAIGERLPYDAAGNVKLPGDMMYAIGPGGKIRKGEVEWAPRCAAYPGYRVGFGGHTGIFSSQQPTPVEECYSTIREAEAARDAGL